MSIDQDSSILNLIKARNQAGNRTLAGPCRTNNRHRLPWLSVQIQTIQHWTATFVAEDDIAELDFAFNGWQFIGIWLIHDLDGHAQHLKDTLGSDTGALQLRILLAQFANGIEETVDIE